MVREAWKVATTICKGVDKMRHSVANITYNLCCDRLQDVGEIQRLEATLVEDEIAYRESVNDVGPSMIIPGPSTY